MIGLRNIRIGIDIRALDTQYTTGVDTYLGKLLENWALNSNGHTFALLGTAGLANHPLVVNMVKLGHTFIGPKFPSKFFNGSMKFFGRPKLDKLVGGVDIFFLPNTMFHSFSENCKTVITFHDLSFERLQSVYSPKRNLWHKLVNPKKEAMRASRVIAVSHSTARDLQSLYGIPKEKIDVIPLGVHFDEYSKSADSTQSRDRELVRGEYILFLGSIEPRKNLSSLLLAFDRLRAKHPNLNLVVAGSFFPQKDKEAYSLVKGIKNVTLHNSVSGNEKRALLQGALITVLPSFYEGFGLPIIESMASGTPVITSASSSMPEVSQGAALLVNPFNAGELAIALDSLLTNEQLRNTLISHGREVAKHYTWQKTAKMTLEVLEAVASK